jgi:hypothetical protein
MRSAQRGELDGILNVGACYAEGIGVRESAAKACEWLERAAERGHVHSQKRVAYFYFGARTTHMKDSLAIDVPRAVKWWELAAQHGDSESSYQVANRYLEGLHGPCWGEEGFTTPGVPEDIPKALHWFRTAAEMGHSDSQYSLGGCYLMGKVPYDEDEGLKWMGLAAGQGNKNATDFLSTFQPMTPQRASEIRTNSDGGNDPFVDNMTSAALACKGCGQLLVAEQLIPCPRCHRVAWCSEPCRLAHGNEHEEECAAASDQSIRNARLRATARRQMRDTLATGAAQTLHSLCATLKILREADAPERDLILNGAEYLAQPSFRDLWDANTAIHELQETIDLGGWEATSAARLDALLRNTKAVARPMREQYRAAHERRRCKGCGTDQLKEAFSENQWRKGSRRCKACQSGNVPSLEQRTTQATEAEEVAAFEALNRERIEAERARIQAELERRNALEHTDSECCVCFDEVNEAERKALSCAHWLCAACLQDVVAADQTYTDINTGAAAPRETACPVCRTVVSEHVLVALCG